jgi:small subunit ribosomal protein S21
MAMEASGKGREISPSGGQGTAEWRGASGTRRNRAIVAYLRARGHGARGFPLRATSFWRGYLRPPNSDRRLFRVQVVVRDNNIDQALKALKKKLQREGVFREMKLRRHYEKPSERRAREAAEAVRRARKVERKRLEREGF